ncbi:MAG: hypothetical protein U0800_22635 [Isosphaeraceae bacterium]
MPRFMPVFRFRLSHLLLMVLFAGMAMGAERTWNQRRIYLDRAAYHAAEEAKYTRYARLVQVEADRMRKYDIGYCSTYRISAKDYQLMKDDMDKQAEEHASHKERFRRAASRPWERGPQTD